MSAQATATATTGPPVGPAFRFALPPHTGAVGRTVAAIAAGWAP